MTSGRLHQEGFGILCHPAAEGSTSVAIPRLLCHVFSKHIWSPVSCLQPRRHQFNCTQSDVIRHPDVSILITSEFRRSPRVGMLSLAFRSGDSWVFTCQDRPKVGSIMGSSCLLLYMCTARYLIKCDAGISIRFQWSVRIWSSRDPFRERWFSLFLQTYDVGLLELIF